MVSCSDAGGNELRLAASCKPAGQTRSQASLSVICDNAEALDLQGAFTASCVYRIHEPVAEQDAELKVHVHTAESINAIRYDTGMTWILPLQCQSVLPYPTPWSWS